MSYFSKNFYIKLSIASINWIAATVALAGPPQIDILGVIPGQASQEQFRTLSNGNEKGDSIEVELGGHKVHCGAEFIEDKLGKMTCITGINESNLETHADLVKGFTKKFGKPDINTPMPWQKGIGGGVVVAWRDKQGNMLTLFSNSLVTQGRSLGMVLLESTASIKNAAKEKSRIDAQRKF